MHRFTCGEEKIWQNIKKSQNIMKMIAGVAKRNENTGVIQGFIFLFLVLLKGMKKGGESNISLCYRRASSQSFRERGGVI